MTYLRSPRVLIAAGVGLTLLLVLLLFVVLSGGTPAPAPGPSASAISASPAATATPSPESTCTNTAPSVAPSPSANPNGTELYGSGDRCAYISVYVRAGDELSALDREAQVSALRISVDSNPTAPSLEVKARPLADGGYALPVSSGASWRVLLDGKRIFNKDSGSGNAVCTELVLHIAEGQATRFVLLGVRNSAAVNCPGAVATVDGSNQITPDIIPPPPALQLNPVRLGRETGQVIQYRPELITYLRSLEETNDAVSFLAVLLFVLGSSGMLLFGGFAAWLKFTPHDLGEIGPRQHLPKTGRQG